MNQQIRFFFINKELHIEHNKNIIQLGSDWI